MRTTMKQAERPKGKRYWQEVQCEGETTHTYHYCLKGYAIALHKDGRPPTCTCQHGSHWGSNKPHEHCYHIKNASHAVRKRGRWQWKE